METISVELFKWLLTAAGVGIAAQAAFIAKLIVGQRKELSEARKEWKTLSDEELERLQNQLNQAQTEKLDAIRQKEEIQNEYVNTLKRLRDNGNEGHT